MHGESELLNDLSAAEPVIDAKAAQPPLTLPDATFTTTFSDRNIRKRWLEM
jgi:hypothetical protein